MANTLEIIRGISQAAANVYDGSHSLTPVGEVEVIVQSTSRVRTWCQAHRFYNIGSISDVEQVGSPSDKKMDKTFKSFLDAGGFKGKEPRNVTRKKE